LPLAFVAPAAGRQRLGRLADGRHRDRFDAGWKPDSVTRIEQIDPVVERRRQPARCNLEVVELDVAGQAGNGFDEAHPQPWQRSEWQQCEQQHDPQSGTATRSWRGHR